MTTPSSYDSLGSSEPFFYAVNLFVPYSCNYDETYILFNFFVFNFWYLKEISKRDVKSIKVIIGSWEIFSFGLIFLKDF